MKKILSTISAIALGTSIASADVAKNKETAVASMNEVLVKLDTSKVDTYFADPYIQHNPLAGSGVAALRGLLEYAKNGDGFGLKTVRVFGEGDYVVMHNIWEGFGPKPMVAFDVFRFNANGKIVEHWDNMIEVQPPNPSGRSQTDGATEITDLDKTEENKAKIEEFITKSLIKHEKVDITKYISPVTYIQHNPAVADGLEGFGAFMAELAEKGLNMEYSKVHKVIGEGNFVLAMSEGAFGGKPLAFYDLFRLENGLIVEHWDVIAEMPSGDLPEGYPGKF